MHPLFKMCVLAGVPIRIRINGILCERVSIDGVWATFDGKPVYVEV